MVLVWSRRGAAGKVQRRGGGRAFVKTYINLEETLKGEGAFFSLFFNVSGSKQRQGRGVDSPGPRAAELTPRAGPAGEITPRRTLTRRRAARVGRP